MAMPMNEFFYGGNEPQWQEIDDMAGFDSRGSGRTLPIIEFWVPMCCPKCEEKVREELSELEGVYDIFVDQLTERVTVTGFVDPFQALKKMKRIKKKSEFWIGNQTMKLSHNRSSHSSRSSHRSHNNHQPRQETIYRASPSRISYNRESSRPSCGPSYRNNYGMPCHDDASYCDLCPASPSLYNLPRIQPLPYETIPPFAQDYYVEDYPEDYMLEYPPFY